VSRPIIHAWKPYGEIPGHLVATEKDDPEAISYEIRYRPIGCNFSSELTVSSLSLAESIAGAMAGSFEAGKKEAFSELRSLIGAKAL
jgi:hypothetical protein